MKNELHHFYTMTCANHQNLHQYFN